MRCANSHPPDRNLNVREVAMTQLLDNRAGNGNAAVVTRPAGVSYDKRSGKYGARINVDGRLKWLGTFDCIEDAESAVELAKGALGDKYTPRRMRSSREIALSKKIPGVRYIRKIKRWEARIKVSGEVIYLGAFSTKAEAAEARWKAEDFHGRRNDVIRKARQ